MNRRTPGELAFLAARAAAAGYGPFAEQASALRVGQAPCGSTWTPSAHRSLWMLYGLTASRLGSSLCACCCGWPVRTSNLFKQPASCGGPPACFECFWGSAGPAGPAQNATKDR